MAGMPAFAASPPTEAPGRNCEKNTLRLHAYSLWEKNISNNPRYKGKYP